MVGLSSVMGGTTVEVSLSTPEESVLAWLVIPFVAWVLHAAVQQIVFFRVILKNAGEGMHNRGMTASPVAMVAVLVAVLFFILIHEELTPLRILDLAVAGGIFGLLYLHTGELAVGIGVNSGSLYTGALVFAVIWVMGSLSGILGAINQYGFTKMVVAYLVVLGWLSWWRGAVSIQDDISRWNGD